MTKFVITPKVDETQEFIEIANDFSNPLDLVREAISNSYDAKASEISIEFDTVSEQGGTVLRIVVKDNGAGMSKDELQNFFDLGNSTRRNDQKSIGEKGHGTKVYFNSKQVEVLTCNGQSTWRAVMEDPFANLYERKIPKVECEELATGDIGTKITILGYNKNRRDRFTHDRLKDYVVWFTKHGTLETQFTDDLAPVTLSLKGLDRDLAEVIQQGHKFPKESIKFEKLFDEYLALAPEYYCKKVVKTGSLKNHPEVSYQAVFYIEGTQVKYGYNTMLRRPGYSAPAGAYKIQERYGLWLCKDYIPVQKKNDWVTYKGSEYTKLHAFVNCQGLNLTANRGSVENTPSELMQDIEDAVKEIYKKIEDSDDWINLEWLESQATAHRTVEKEKRSFDMRKKKVNRSNIATYENITLVEPEQENGVFSMFLMLSMVKADLFPFQIIDYDTHEGIDVIAKGDKTTPISSARLFFVEFKNILEKSFNHSFENIHSIVCWDTKLKHDEVIRDIADEERKMVIVAPASKGEATSYFLDHPSKAHKIQVYCLKQYLKQKLGIEFQPRDSASTV